MRTAVLVVVLLSAGAARGAEPVPLVPKVRDAVQPDGVQPGVREHQLEVRASRRVTASRGLQVLPQPGAPARRVLGHVSP